MGIYLKDRTEIKELDEKKTEEKYKNLLLFSLSHELMTPMNGIIGILENLIPKMAGIQKNELKIQTNYNPMTSGKKIQSRASNSITNSLNYSLSSHRRQQE